MRNRPCKIDGLNDTQPIFKDSGITSIKMEAFTGRFVMDVLVINEWVFEKTKDPRFICQRSSGPL
jgi:hypothetical protein